MIMAWEVEANPPPRPVVPALLSRVFLLESPFHRAAVAASLPHQRLAPENLPRLLSVQAEANPSVPLVNQPHPAVLVLLNLESFRAAAPVSLLRLPLAPAAVSPVVVPASPLSAVTVMMNIGNSAGDEKLDS